MKRVLIIFATALLLLSACTQIHYVPIEELFPELGGGKIQYVASSDSELRDILRKAHNGDEIFLNGLSIDPTSGDFTPYEINKDVEIGGFLKLSKEASARILAASRANTGTIVIFTVNDTAAAIINEFSVDIDDSIAPDIKAIIETDRGKITAESFTLNYSGSTSIVAINLGINANADSLAGNLQGLIVTIDENNENKKVRYNL